jgi:signal peptidase I
VADEVTTLFQAEPQAPSPPKPWLAALLGAGAPGTGQLYAGRPLRAVGVSTAAVAMPALSLLAVTGLDAAAERIAALTLLALLLVIGSAVDAWHVAQAPGQARTIWRRWYVLAAYVGLLLFGLRPLVGAVSSRLVQIYTVDGVAMSLTLIAGDRVLATPLTGRIRPRMVVVWRTSDGRSVTHRVVAMPGESVAMRNFTLLVNGLEIEGAAAMPVRWQVPRANDFAWQSEYLADSTPADQYFPTYGDWGPLRVPAGHYFVLGDNRYGSRDSRHLGFVRRDQIIARVRWVFASLDETRRHLRFERMGHDVN